MEREVTHLISLQFGRSHNVVFMKQKTKADTNFNRIFQKYPHLQERLVRLEDHFPFKKTSYFSNLFFFQFGVVFCNYRKSKLFKREFFSEKNIIDNFFLKNL